MARQFDEMKRVVESGAVKPPTEDLAFVFAHSDSEVGIGAWYVIAKGDQVVNLTFREIVRILRDFTYRELEPDADVT